jgi:hypothetical protein
MNPSPRCIAEAQYFEGRQYVGSRRAAIPDVPDFWPSVAYFCPTCGELWGRMIYQFPEDYTTRSTVAWMIERRRCVKHGDGQFLVGYDLHPLENFSSGLLKREAEVLLYTTKET